MNLKGFLKRRRRRKQRERQLENTFKKTTLLNMRLADLQVFNTLKDAQLEQYLHSRKHQDYSR